MKPNDKRILAAMHRRKPTPREIKIKIEKKREERK